MSKGSLNFRPQWHVSCLYWGNTYCSLRLFFFLDARMYLVCRVCIVDKTEPSDASFGGGDGGEARPLGARRCGVRHGPARAGNGGSVSGALRHTKRVALHPLMYTMVVVFFFCTGCFFLAPFTWVISANCEGGKGGWRGYLWVFCLKSFEH